MFSQYIAKLLTISIMFLFGMSLTSISNSAEELNDIYVIAKDDPDRDRTRDRDRLRDQSCEERLQELRDDCKERLQDRDRDRDRERDRDKEKDYR